MKNYVIKSNICYSKLSNEICIVENGYLVCEENKCACSTVSVSRNVQCSKLRWRLLDQSVEPLTIKEVFYLATKGGGEFFGKVGSFEEGYEFDAVVIEDATIRHPQELSVKECLERVIYLAEDRNVIAKFVDGKKIL